MGNRAIHTFTVGNPGKPVRFFAVTEDHGFADFGEAVSVEAAHDAMGRWKYSERFGDGFFSEVSQPIDLTPREFLSRLTIGGER